MVNGYKEIVELLIANGADVNAKNKTKFTFIKNQASLHINNPTALDWAIISKQTEIVDLLRKHGAKNLKLKANETTTNHNNRSLGAGGVWAVSSRHRH